MGANAVAGVGAGGMYVWLSSGFSTMTRMGGQVFAAQELGKGRREEARQYAKAAVQLVILMGVLYGVVCLAFTDQLIGFFQLSDAESVAIGIQYTKITCGLILFSFLNFTLTGLYTAQGDSRTPFVANFAGMAANIVLDPLFIFGAGPIPGMQAAGAAVATVCSQIIVTMVLVVCTLKSRKDADNENILKHMYLTTLCKKWYYREVCRIGIPSALQSIVYCGISMVLTRMVSSFGSAAVAAQRVGGQIESISWNTADGFGTAMNAFAGQELWRRQDGPGEEKLPYIPDCCGNLGLDHYRGISGGTRANFQDLFPRSGKYPGVYRLSAGNQCVRGVYVR